MLSFLALALCLVPVQHVYADDVEPPTFISDPNQGPHETGLVKPAPLTMDQFKADKEFTARSKEEGWTFDFNVRQMGAHATGLVKPKTVNMAMSVHKLAAGDFVKAETRIPARFHLNDFGVKLSGIFNQGQCGSCVYNSIVKNFQEHLLLRGGNVPVLSRSQLMNCGTDGQCRGSWGMNVSNDLVKLGGLKAESAYPYRPVTARCQDKAGDMFGPIKSRQEIKNDPKTIASAVLAGYPVSVTVGAGGAWGSYDSGIYNACGRVGTNHEVLIYGYDCETSTELVDGVEYCKFDSNGKLPNGVGIWFVPNSWGENWGENGHMRTKMTSKSGALCNNIAEEAIILESGIPMPPKEPVLFQMETSQVSLKVKIDVGAGAWNKASLTESISGELKDLEKK